MNWTIKQKVAGDITTFYFTNKATKETFYVRSPKIDEAGRYSRNGVPYIGLPILMYPTVTRTPSVNDFTLRLYPFHENGISCINGIYEPTGRLFYLTKPDKAIIRKAYGVRVKENIISDSFFAGKDIRKMLTKNECKRYRVITLNNRVGYELISLTYREKLTNNDVNIILNQTIRNDDLRILKENEVHRLITQRQILIPFGGSKVYRKHFKNYLCFHSTPQSEMAGKIVSMCEGVKIVNGRLKKGTSIFSEHLTNAIAVPQFIQPERALLIHSAVGQIVPTKAKDEPIVRSIHYKSGTLLGARVPIAMMDYGNTSNDGIIISETLANMLKSTEITAERFILVPRTYTIVQEIGNIVCKGAPMIQKLGDSYGYIRCESVRSENAIIKNIYTIQTTNGSEVLDVVVFEYEETFETTIGSKLSGLHSNKHIVSSIVPDALMPKSSFDRIHAIVSPATVGKRNNHSYLFEGMVGHITNNDKLGKDTYIKVKPFDKEITFEYAYNLVKGMEKDLGYEIPKNFNFQLYNNLGHPFRHKTFVGYHLLLRLEHHPERKLANSFMTQTNQDGLINRRGMAGLTPDEINMMDIKGQGLALEYLRKNKKTKTKEVELGLDFLKTLNSLTLGKI